MPPREVPTASWSSFIARRGAALQKKSLVGIGCEFLVPVRHVAVLPSDNCKCVWSAPLVADRLRLVNRQALPGTSRGKNHCA